MTTLICYLSEKRGKYLWPKSSSPELLHGLNVAQRPEYGYTILNVANFFWPGIARGVSMAISKGLATSYFVAIQPRIGHVSATDLTIIKVVAKSDKIVAI